MIPTNSITALTISSKFSEKIIFLATANTIHYYSGWFYKAAVPVMCLKLISDNSERFVAKVD